MSNPVLFPGKRHVDDRGCFDAVNEFDFEGVKRFYTIRNHRNGYVRAWHAHRREAKWVTVIQGVAIIGAVKINDWQQPSPDLIPFKFVLSEYEPSILHIPAGYANGFKTLMPNTTLLFFSSATIEESVQDDYRFYARYWNIWEENER